MTRINIPPAALEAGCSAYTAVIYRGNGTITEFREAIRAAFEAMVAAWPNGNLHVPVGAGQPRKSFTLPALILPLPQEGGDE